MLNVRKSSRIALLPLVLLLSACSFTFMYPRADFFLGWQIDSYLRLESAQERWLDERLEARLRWHHQQELPRWRDWLVALRNDVAEQRIDEAGYEQYMDQLSQLLRATSAGLIDDGTALIQRLSDEQAKALLERLQEETDEEIEELADESLEEHLEQRYERSADNYEDWFGRLSDEQRQAVRDYVQQSPDMRPHVIESRQRWYRYIEEVLANRHDDAATRAAVQRMLTEPESLRTPEYQALWQQRGEQRKQMLGVIYRSASDEQRQHLLEELDEWIEDFNEMIARDI